MSWFNEFIDSTKRVVLLDATFDRIDNAAALTTEGLDDLDGEVDDLDKRVVRLEALKPQDEEVSSLKERVTRLEEARDTAKPLLEEIVKLNERIVKLETARDADLARIEAALTQLSAERSRLDADVERHITRLQRETPQLPPTPTTNN